MKTAILNIIIFLVIYLPFEDFILKWLPVSELTFTILRQIPDLIIFSLSLLIFLTTLYKRNKIDIVRKSLFIILLLFIINAIFSLIINNGSFFHGIINLKAMIRYIFLIYIVNYIKPDKKDIKSIMKYIFFIAFIQMAIGLTQYIFGEKIMVFFQPRILHISEFQMNFSALKGEINIFGTMAQEVSFSYFILLSSILWLTVAQNYIKSKFIFYIVYLCFFFIICISGSRATLICSLAGLLLYIYYNRNFKKTVSYLSLSLIIIFSALPFIKKGNSNEDFFFMFSPKYVKMLEKQRLGIVKYILINYTEDSKLLFGLSPDKNKVVDYIKEKYAPPPALYKLMDIILEDIYWVAIIIYYGLVGFVLFIFFLFILFKEISKTDRNTTELDQSIQTFCKIMTIILLLLNIIAPILEIRQFAFYYWLFVAYALNEGSSNKNNESNKIGALKHNENITNKQLSLSQGRIRYCISENFQIAQRKRSSSDQFQCKRTGNNRQ